MKNTRKKVLSILAVSMFALMMVFSVTTSMNGLNFSLSGYEVLANGSTMVTCTEFGQGWCSGSNGCVDGVDEEASGAFWTCFMTCNDGAIIWCPLA